MKAWMCSYYNYDDNGTILVHAKTRGKARERFHFLAGDFSYDFVDVKAVRFPELDDEPFTFENCHAAGFDYLNDNGEILENNSYYLECDCELCRSVK